MSCALVWCATALKEGAAQAGVHWRANVHGLAVRATGQDIYVRLAEARPGFGKEAILEHVRPGAPAAQPATWRPALVVQRESGGRMKRTTDLSGGTVAVTSERCVSAKGDRLATYRSSDTRAPPGALPSVTR